MRTSRTEKTVVRHPCGDTYRKDGELVLICLAPGLKPGP
jgi:hypothetical protein